MKKTRNSLLFAFILLFLTLAVFAQDSKSLVPIDIDIGGQHYTFHTSKDVTAQIELREAKVVGNNNEIKYINSQKIRVIEKNKLSLWGRMWHVDIQEYDRQIKGLEDANKRFKKEIGQLNKVLRKFK